MGYETRIRGALAIEASGYDQFLYELHTNLYGFCNFAATARRSVYPMWEKSFKVKTL